MNIFKKKDTTLDEQIELVNAKLGKDFGEDCKWTDDEGRLISDAYVEYNPRDLIDSFRRSAERAVREKLISPAERKTIMNVYENGIRGYTYFER